MRTSIRRTTMLRAAVLSVGAVMTVAGAAGGAPVTTNLVFWADASDLDGDGVAEGLGESGLTGTQVDAWVNKSATNGASQATQATALQRPNLVPGALGGLPVVRFDGNDDFLQSTAFTSELFQPTQMFIVWKADSVGGGGGIAVDGGVTSSSKRQAISFENVSGMGNSIGVFSGLAVPANYYATPFSGPVQMTALFNDLNNGPGAPDSSFRINGVDANTSAPSGDWQTDGVTLGGRFATFGGDRISLDGYIAELLIYSSPLSATDRDATEQYLITKWNVPEPSSAGAMMMLAGASLLQRRNRRVS